MAEDKARDRRESLDSGGERNAVFRSQGPDADRMDFINGLISAGPVSYMEESRGIDVPSGPTRLQSRFVRRGAFRSCRGGQNVSRPGTPRARRLAPEMRDHHHPREAYRREGRLRLPFRFGGGVSYRVETGVFSGMGGGLRLSLWGDLRGGRERNRKRRGIAARGRRTGRGGVEARAQ